MGYDIKNLLAYNEIETKCNYNYLTYKHTCEIYTYIHIIKYTNM